VAIQSWENVVGQETARETIISTETERWWLQNRYALKRRERLREDRREGQTSQVIDGMKTSEANSKEKRSKREWRTHKATSLIEEKL
jgi:hypothetical protein